MPTFRDAFCILQVTDVRRTVDFYCEHFGFAHEYSFPTDGTPVYASLTLGGSKLAVGLADGELHPTSAAVWIYADDVDAAYGALTQAGVRGAMEPADQPWGERLADVLDPDGYVVHIGQAASEA